jgi:hypothetical protein
VAEDGDKVTFLDTPSDRHHASGDLRRKGALLDLDGRASLFVDLPPHEMAFLMCTPHDLS